MKKYPDHPEASRSSVESRVESLQPVISESSMPTGQAGMPVQQSGRSNLSKKKGFTLLEIMIALAIIGTAVIAILSTVNHHADVAYENILTTRMLFIAREKITEMEINPAKSKGIIKGTDFTFENMVNKTDNDGIIELRTIISQNSKQVVLRELIMNKKSQNQQ